MQAFHVKLFILKVIIYEVIINGTSRTTGPEYQDELFQDRRGPGYAKSYRGSEKLLQVVSGRRLREVFRDVSPIQDYTGNLILEFPDYKA
jgi:hypothetical protein